MGKTKNKNHSELEHFKGLVKQLEAENKSLKREIKRLERREHFFENPEAYQEEPVDLRTPCSCCGKGHLEDHFLLNRFWQTCNICDFRTKTTILDTMVDGKAK